MTRRLSALSLILLLVLTTCSSEEQVATTTSTSTSTTTASTTTTTLPPTTTTTVPMTIEGATPELSAVVDGFYDFALGASTAEPLAPAPVLASLRPGSVSAAPRTGIASIAVFGDAQVAAVEMGEDVFLLVADGGGWRIVGGIWTSLSIPHYFGEGPRHVAVVGSDARPRQNVERSRADSIHFVGMDGKGGAAVVGLPRDSYVPVPGIGRRKVNSALSLGGPDTMMATFENLTAIDFEGYILTGFSGFQGLVTDVLGGVMVEVPFAINDRWAHVALSAGEQLLNGAQALGFARARKTMPAGDFTRSGHQGEIIIGAARTVGAMGYIALPKLMERSLPYLYTDLSAEQLLTFSAMAIGNNLNSVPNVVAPGRSGSAGGASVVFLSDSVGGLWRDLADGRLDD